LAVPDSRPIPLGLAAGRRGVSGASARPQPRDRRGSFLAQPALRRISGLSSAGITPGRVRLARLRNFDPICGDGTAHAIREAILATAVLRAIDKGDSTEALVAHYEARLTARFRRHLTLCRAFYCSGGTSPFWTAEQDAIDRGIQWCDDKLGAHPEFRYQLRGFELEAVR
jgi:hypothetical protein